MTREEISNGNFGVEDRFITVDNIDFLPVKNVYVYTYDYGNGKTVLRMEFKDSVIGFDALKSLFSNQKCIYEYELSRGILNPDTADAEKVAINLKLNAEHTNYIKDYKCSFDNGVYAVEITHATALELLSKNNKDNSLALMVSLVDIYETTL